MGSKIRDWNLGVNQARVPQFHGIQRRSESESADLRSVPFSLQICAYHTFIFFGDLEISRMENPKLRNQGLKVFVCLSGHD